MKIDFSGENILKSTSIPNWTEEIDKKAHETTGLKWVNKLFSLYFNYSGIGENKIPSEFGELFQEFISKALCIFLITLFSPIMLVVGICVKLSSPGKVLYKQTRVGKDGQLFEIYKFRSMVDNAESSTGHTLSWEGDPRITQFGNFLRKSHLDELPQLFNVLKGEMNFIGPRPERPEFTNEYDVTITNYKDRHTVKPGITGLAQISLVYDAEADHKLKFDLLYIKNKDSIILNLLIALYTMKKMLFLKPTADLAVK